MNFSTLGISNEMIKILEKNNITNPTPIQVETIPHLMKGKDVIAQAQTGTGKTLAFALPIMERINRKRSFVQALVITPTRELAIQITEETRKLAPAKGINILAAYGGQDVEAQVKKLKGNIHLVIGTPGRLLDHLRRRTVDFSQLSFLVLDEADQMLNMGFLEDVELIINQTSDQRQTLCFSATMPEQIRILAERYMRQPLKIQIQSKTITLNEIKQVVVESTERGKLDALCKTIEEYNPYMAIIFCRTKRRVTALNEELQKRGYKSDELHGDLSQAKREKVMKAFRRVEMQFLVATDVAARGLDIEGVTHIFNYDIPQDTESYIHRIGRTGRAGQTGVAVTFVNPKDRRILNLIQKEIKMNIEKRKIDAGGDNDSSTPGLRERLDRAYDKPKAGRTSGSKGFSKDREFGAERSSGRKKSTGRFSDKPTDKPAGKRTGKPKGKPIDKPIGKFMGTGKPISKPTRGKKQASNNQSRAGFGKKTGSRPSKER